MQRNLSKSLSDLSATSQVIVSTHSPHFINWSDIRNGARLYRLTSSDKGTVIWCLNGDTLDYLQRLLKDFYKPYLLDTVAKEIFFADEMIFVEGQEDMALMRKFQEDNDLHSLPFFGYGVGGADNIRPFLRMATAVGIKCAAIYDNDKKKQEEIEKARKEFPDVCIEVLPTSDIRDKHDDNDQVVKDGIFDRSGNIKPVYRDYVISLLGRIESSFTSACGGERQDSSAVRDRQ